jgi:hypothetical protein
MFCELILFDMKKLNILFVLAGMMLIAASCGKKVNVAFTTSEINVVAEGGEVSASLTSNGDWTVDSSPEWLTVSPTSGSGDTQLLLNVTANNGMEVRSGQVKVSSKDNVATLTVTQDFATEYLRVSPDNIGCDRWGNTFEISVESNLAWTLSGLPEWITASVTEGSNDGLIEVVVAPIEGEVSAGRQATLVFNGGGLEAQVSVNQSHESGLVFSVSPLELNMPYTGGTETLTVTSTIAWTANVESDWMTLSLNSGDGDAEVTVNVAENADFVGRESKVEFVYTFPGGSVGRTIVLVRQEAAPDPHFLTVSPQEFSFGKEGGTAEITVECDVDWTVDLQSDWVSVSANSGTGNATVLLTVAPNNITDPRMHEFWIVSGNLKRNVTVSQEEGEEPAVVMLSPDTLYTSYTGGVETLSVTANVPWSVETSASWIYMVSSTGNGNGTQDLIVDVNSTITPRTAEVIARYNGQIMDRTIVVQEAKPIVLQADITEINVPAEGGEYVVNITSTLNWVVGKGAPWLKYEPESGMGNGQIVIIVEPLNSTHDRSTEILIQGEYDTTVTITVYQSN